MTYPWLEIHPTQNIYHKNTEILLRVLIFYQNCIMQMSLPFSKFLPPIFFNAAKFD